MHTREEKNRILGFSGPAQRHVMGPLLVVRSFGAFCFPCDLLQIHENLTYSDQDEERRNTSGWPEGYVAEHWGKNTPHAVVRLSISDKDFEVAGGLPKFYKICQDLC